jgi:predicted MFS family arabinose efflux permease
VAQGLNIPILQTLLAGAAPIEYRAMFMALNSMTLRLGQTLGPPLMGWVYGLYGIGTVFYVGAGLSLVMLALASVLIDG